MKKERTENPGSIVPGIVKDCLGIWLRPDAIEMCHRLGTRTLNINRPIVVRFRFRDTKYDIMKQRKALKGSGITFGEDLCEERRDLQRVLLNHGGKESCWASNGKLMAKNKVGKIAPSMAVH